MLVVVTVMMMMMGPVANRDDERAGPTAQGKAGRLRLVWGSLLGD